jgi:hypothetical protein
VRSRVPIVAALLALVCAGGAAAHVTVQPAFLVGGQTTALGFDSPNERDLPMTALTIEIPAGVDVLSVETPPGWSAVRRDDTVRWSGGRVLPRATVVFGMRVRSSRPPGPVAFRANQHFEDGASVPWTASLTVLPGTNDAPDQHLGRAFVAAVVGVVVITGSLLLVRRLRRRPLQER